MKDRGIDSQVSPHDDEEVTPFGNLGLEELSVIESLLRRVDGAGTNDNDESVVISGQNSRRIVASRSNGLLGGSSGDNLVTEQSRLDKGVVLGWNESEMKSVGKIIINVRQ